MMQRGGHDIRIGCIEKEITTRLLSHYGLPHVSIGLSQKEVITKTLDTVRKDFRMVRLIREFNPGIVVSTGIPYASHAAKLSGIPSIAFSDTEIATLVIKSMLPFVSAVCTPSCFSLDLGSKHIRYDGYHELAYLHPNYFEPDPSVLESAGLERGEAFVLSRFSSADSSHDFGWSGFSFRNSADALSFYSSLEKEARVFLTSEQPLPPRLRKYSLDLPFHKFHDLLAFASLYIGEGATIASEAGVLGVPWIFVSSNTRGYLTDQETEYGLGYVIDNKSDAEEKASELLGEENLKRVWQSKREKLLAEKIDVTDFIVRFVEDWPASLSRERGGHE